MRDSEQRDDLDLRLDAALASYAAPEENPHLAAQIIAQVRQQRSRPRPFRWLPWAIPALAILLLVALAVLHRAPARFHAASPAPAIAAIAPPARGPAAATQPGAIEALRTRTTTNAGHTRIPIAQKDRSLPKREVFPTPSPLTPQERALAALVNNNPGNVARAVADSQQHPVEPLSIATIRIPPLNPPEKDEN